MRKKKRKVNLKKKLWDIFSKVMRMRNADESGNVKCITCPQIYHWTQMDAGHCIAKSLGMAIYFDERNVRAQCKSCNLAHKGRQHEYVLALEKEYGPDIFEELTKQQRNIRQIKAWEYEELIEKYELELKNLMSRQPDTDGPIFGAR